MLCVVCPHCQQMMSAADEAVGEAVACPMCQKHLQVPANAPRLPNHLSPGGAPAPALARAAVGGGGGGRGAAAVAAPPAPAGPPYQPAPAASRSTLPLGILVLVGAMGIVAAVLIFVLPKLGGKKATIKGGGEANIQITEPHKPPPEPINPNDMKASQLFKAYFDNALSADETYKDKEVTLSGIVASVGAGEGNYRVDLLGADRSRDLTQIVRCLFTLKHRDRLKSVQNGQPIRIHGTCKGKIDGRVVLRDCQVSEE
jgi:hypothetical protein